MIGVNTYRVKGVETYRVKGVDTYRVKGVDTVRSCEEIFITTEVSFNNFHWTQALERNLDSVSSPTQSIIDVWD